MDRNKVVLVDNENTVLGVMDKMQAHQHGVLHRAISIFLSNEVGELLLQQRAKTKYHSPLQWTNACCSHPFLDESFEDAAKRRLQEELGISVPLTEKFRFSYKAEVGLGLWEHEYDCVFEGLYKGEEFHLNPEEVAAIRWITPADLQREIQETPEQFTPWFRIICNEYWDQLS